ncbi:MAG: UDP-N-acetylglucosamine 2-epimerase (hydrolyzing) [Candidatus Aenigmarchaeota archaeon]|nr:UDP-N-acetylglucosamine 2-epimerase (hydrolyzing) [Candidatus Aenigmarchaeota archaeon]
MNKKIAVVTGTRAEYGYLKPLIEKILGRKGLTLLLYVTGMHIVKEYGNTVNEIVKDGFEIRKIIDMDVKENNTVFDTAISISNGVKGFTKAFQEDSPDMVVVFGDRTEPFSAAVAATTVNIPVAHINGGDVGFGDLDNNLRHAITKLSHLHFTASHQSMCRVLKLGEEKWRVFNAGALSLDSILNKKLSSRKDILDKYSIPDRKIILVVFHPVTTEYQDSSNQMNIVMQSVKEIAEKHNSEIVTIYPNAYPGGYEIIKVIKNFSKKSNKIHVFENISHLDYLSMLSISSVFLGNSSSGIIEAPSLGIPYVCIANRQYGRERGYNVIDVECKKSYINKAVEKAMFNKKFIKIVEKRKSPYGNGKASEFIVDILSRINIDKRLLQKKITY